MATTPSTAVVPLRSNRVSIAPFDEWTYEDARKALIAQLPADYDIRKKFAVDHDHLQNGTQWVGPGSAQSNDKIKQQFAPDDVIGEALQNIANSFREPQLGFAPLETPEEGEELPEVVAQRIEEAQSLLSAWWDRRRLHEHIQNRLKTSAWAGSSGLRLWIPGRFLIRNGDNITMRQTNDIAEALDYIHVSAPLPKTGAIVVHEATQERCAVFLDEETITVNGKDEVLKRAELVYLDPERDRDEDAETILRVVYDDERRQGYETTLDLGGRLLFAEMHTRPLLTEPIIRTQRQLNLLTSLVTRIAETAAFRERYTTNARPQGLRILYNEGDKLPNGSFLERDEEGRQWAVIPQERTLGANTTTELVGLPKYNDQGQPAGNETPGITVVDPVDPGPYIEAAGSVRGRILRMCSQGHLAMNATAESSGFAYEQSRAVFEKDLNARRVAEEGMLRELLTSVLALAEQISGQEGYFTEFLRVTVDQYVDAGPRSPESARLDMEAHEKGLLSRPTAMSRMGVEDVDAELARVRASVAYTLEVLSKASELATVFSADAVLRTLVALGLPEEVASALVPSDTDDLPPEV